MVVSLPNIDIIFRQKAYSFIARSARGNVILIIKDDTNKAFNAKEYRLSLDLEKDEALYTPTNLQYIKDAMTGMPNKIIVVRIDADGKISDALTIAQKYNTGWIGIADGVKADMDALAVWTKQIRKLKKTFKSVVAAPTVPSDSEGVVVIGNETVTFLDTRGEVAAEKFIPTLLGYLAGANVQKGTTYMKMANLKSVTAMEDEKVNIELNKGKMMLINDEEIVKIGLGINSLTTFGTDKTDDFRYIEFVEVMDMVLDDIRKTFKDDFIGKYKNHLDNQYIFVSAVNGYFKALTKDEILDVNFDNKSDIDVATQRQMWIDVGKKEAADWDDAKVKNMTFKRQLFILANVKILQSITDLSFLINMA